MTQYPDNKNKPTNHDKLAEHIWVVSAPSGTGKTTLNRKLVHAYPEIALSVSHTTRPKRPGEKDGVDYHFVSVADFKSMIAEGLMLEHAEVFGNFYGTSISQLRKLIDKHRTIILEIDVQGFEQIKNKLPGIKGVFIVPPSMQVLKDRLENRATDSQEARIKRLLTARDEISKGMAYQNFIINDHIDSAYGQLEKLIHDDTFAGLTHIEGKKFCEKLLAELNAAPWYQEYLRLYDLMKKKIS